MLEPRATGPTRRVRMLEKAADIGIPIYMRIAPVYPFHGIEVVADVVRRTAHQPLREVFCEVLNPKGGNMDRMIGALADRPDLAAQIADYEEPLWSRFTYKVLEFGHRAIRRFVPWPDTMARWRKHLTADHSAFLDRFLPAPQPAKTPV